MEEHAKIFSNVEYIVILNQKLREKIKECLTEQPIWSSLGPVFIPFVRYSSSTLLLFYLLKLRISNYSIFY